jgi:hypothetical protein
MYIYVYIYLYYTHTHTHTHAHTHTHTHTHYIYTYIYTGETFYDTDSVRITVWLFILTTRLSLENVFAESESRTKTVA